MYIYIYVYLVIYTVQYYTDSLTIVSDHQICLQHLQLIRNVAVADSSFAAHLLEIDVTGEQRLAGDSTCYWRVFRLEHLQIIYRNIEVSYGFLWFPMVSYGFLWFPMVSLRCSLLIMGMVWGSVGIIGP